MIKFYVVGNFNKFNVIRFLYEKFSLDFHVEKGFYRCNRYAWENSDDGFVRMFFPAKESDMFRTVFLLGGLEGLKHFFKENGYEEL